jgi:hypothetical protein
MTQSATVTRAAQHQFVMSDSAANLTAVWYCAVTRSFLACSLDLEHSNMFAKFASQKLTLVATFDLTSSRPALLRMSHFALIYQFSK